MSEAISAVWPKLYEDPAFTRLVRVAATHWAKLSDYQKFVVHAYWFQLTQVAADQYAQSSGAMKPGSQGLRITASVVGMMRMPGAAQWWGLAKFFYEPGFHQLIDKLLAENAPGTDSWMNFPLSHVDEDDVRLVLGEGQRRSRRR